MADEKIPQHKDLAAFHAYELGREYDPERPDFASDAAGQRRTEYRYLIQLAHRRSQSSCVLVAIERIAASLAIADGEPWPACNRAINPERPELQRQAIAAQRRQRYRHLARIVHSEVMNYYELGTDNEDYRQHVIEASALQVMQDKQLVSAQRKSIGLPSTVTQMRKDQE